MKDRIGVAMIEALERDGKITPEDVLVEPTSGNTGIALAFVAAAKGYRLVVTMPESVSLERRKVLRLLGAELLLTPAARACGAIAKAAELLAAFGADGVMPQQFENPANPAIHEATTAPELWNDTDGAMDVFVAGSGDGRNVHGRGPLLEAEEALGAARRRRAGPLARDLGRRAGPAQDPGDRRRVHPEEPRHVSSSTRSSR